jgi:hypothetical protein
MRKSEQVLDVGLNRRHLVEGIRDKPEAGRDVCPLHSKVRKSRIAVGHQTLWTNHGICCCAPQRNQIDLEFQYAKAKDQGAVASESRAKIRTSFVIGWPGKQATPRDSFNAYTFNVQLQLPS